MPFHVDRSSAAVRTVAAFEAFKGIVAVCAASGLLALAHRDLHSLAVRLVEHAHLNPAAKYPGIFIAAAEHAQSGHLWLIALGAVAYASLRFVESYGLFTGAAWAEVLAAGSGAIYLPFELIELIRKPSWLGVGAIVANLLVVGLMLHALWRRRVVASGGGGPA